MIPMIVNPAAGGGRCRGQVPGAVTRLAQRGLAVRPIETTGPGHATALARQLFAEGHHTLLCAGGDGTTFEVVNGLFPLANGVTPRLGILPLGTGNSFLRDFGITDATGALDAVASGRTTRVDLVHATHTTGEFHYINLLSIGFTSEVGALTNRRFKALGAAGYAVATVIEVARLKHRVFPIALDGGPVDRRPCAFLSFNNSRCTGGTMQMAPNADPRDGSLDVIRVGPMGRLDLLQTFPKIYDGKHLDHPLNEACTARSVRFELDGPVAIMVDGEILSHQLTALQVVPGALELLA